MLASLSDDGAIALKALVELSGAGVRIPHCFPQGFTLGSVLRITLQEMKKLPLKDREP